mgnify:CR=1 FL=1
MFDYVCLLYSAIGPLRFFSIPPYLKAHTKPYPQQLEPRDLSALTSPPLYKDKEIETALTGDFLLAYRNCLRKELCWYHNSSIQNHKINRYIFDFLRFYIRRIL